MRKSEWVDEGAIVLVGVRDMIGDILHLVDTRLYGKLKQLPETNPLLFTLVENEDAKALTKKIEAVECGEALDDEFFDRIEEDRDQQKRDRDQELQRKRDLKYLEEDVNIDDI